MDKYEFVRNELAKNIELVMKAKETLLLTFDSAIKIKMDNELTMSESNEIEALCARFSRLSDLYTQRILKPMFILMQEDVLTFIDRANLAEKYGIISDAERLISIRRIRNEIAHDYVVENLFVLYNEVLVKTKVLTEIIESTLQYIETNKLIKP